MIRAVIDTNVFASGIFWKGPPYKILDAWVVGKFKMIATAEILNEYETVIGDLSTRYGYTEKQRILELVKLNAEFVSPVLFTKPVCRDPKDDMFLSAALAGNAKYLVSGDKDLLVIDVFKGISIIKPKEFLSKL
ncbi:MAG: putative toxin-antitoxin system toxin component, PIN family [Xanthomonadaceae bacterium]|nr:putative toxin-antitoxin system toxin component, PIN family [Xanthomonadaceae bacterium]